MGLGKTMQCAAFLAGMVHSRLIQRAIVLAPKTLLGQWGAELRRCGLAGRVFEYHGTSAADRQARVHVQPVAGFEDRMSLCKNLMRCSGRDAALPNAHSPVYCARFAA